MSKIKLRRAKESSIVGILTASAFLGKDGKEAYITSSVLLQFIDTARNEDIEEMDSFFSLIKENLKMAINRRELTDRGGNKYKYENFLRPKGPEGVKVVLIGDMQRFITEYQQGAFTIDFTLEELVEEAEKAL